MREGAELAQQTEPVAVPQMRAVTGSEMPMPDFRLKKFDLPGGKIKKGIFRPKRTLDIPRSEMPQTKSREDFIAWLRGQGVVVEKVMIAPKDVIRDPNTKEKRLGHAQSQMMVSKAIKFVHKGTTLQKPIILSRDGVIFDGNHHWLSRMMIAPKVPIEMYKVDMSFDKLKKMTIKYYPDVTFEESVFVSWCIGRG